MCWTDLYKNIEWKLKETHELSVTFYMYQWKERLPCPGEYIARDRPLALKFLHKRKVVQPSLDLILCLSPLHHYPAGVKKYLLDSYPRNVSEALQQY